MEGLVCHQDVRVKRWTIVIRPCRISLHSLKQSQINKIHSGRCAATGFIVSILRPEAASQLKPPEPTDISHTLRRCGQQDSPASSRSSSSDRWDGRSRLRLLCCHGCGHCAHFAGNRGISDRSGPQSCGPQFLRGSASDVSTIHTGAKPLEVHHRVLAPDRRRHPRVDQ